MKILHFADVHLGMENYGKFDPQTGLNSRLGDFLNSFDFLVNYVKTEMIDLVVFSGDAYKTREPSPTYERAFASRIYEIARSNTPVVLLVGNHDFPNALGKANTLDIYKTLNVPNVYLLKDEIILIHTRSGQIQVAGLPWFTKQQLLNKDSFNLPFAKMHEKMSQALAQKVKYLSSKVNPNLPAILVSHASVEGSTFGSERSIMIGSDIILPIDVLRQSRFNYIALGHIHKFQEIISKPPVIYSGSIERIDFGEEKEDKGFVEIDIERTKTNQKTTCKFIKTPARRFLTIRVQIYKNDDPTEKVLKGILKENLKDAIVRVVITINDDQQQDLQESRIRASLSQANFIAGIIKEVKTSLRTQIKIGYSDELTSLDTLGVLEKYLTTKKISLGHKNNLLKVAEALIEED